MLKDLSAGIKISITRSITTAFEQYMEKISWDENKYDLSNFIKEWRTYINNHSTWFAKVDEQIKNNPRFHEDLAIKINETIEKIINEEPTEEQIQKLNELQKKFKKEITYSCKAEAKYLIETLEKQLEN